MNRLFYQGVVPTSGDIQTDYFPAAATAGNTLPSLQCYYSTAAAGPYTQFASDATGSYNCMLITDAGGTRAMATNLDPGLFVSFVVLY